MVLGLENGNCWSERRFRNGIYIYVFMYVYIYLKSTNGFRCGTINSKEVINFKRAIGLNQSHQYL